MAKERIVTRGIVLRVTDNQEADHILTILTDKLGKIAVTAKGSRSRHSRYAAAAQLLAYSELTISESRGWYYLAEGSTLEVFNGVRQDMELLSLGSYFAELTGYVISDETEAGAMLPLLLNALYALGTLHRPPALVKAAFELRLLTLIGFAPLLEGCERCGAEEPIEPVLDLLGGTLLCRRCAEGAQTVPLTPGALAAARHAIYGDSKRLYSFTLEPQDLRIFSQAAESYQRSMLDKPFRTLDFYRSLQSYEIAQQSKPDTNDPMAPHETTDLHETCHSCETNNIKY